MYSWESMEYPFASPEHHLAFPIRVSAPYRCRYTRARDQFQDQDPELWNPKLSAKPEGAAKPKEKGGQEAIHRDVHPRAPGRCVTLRLIISEYMGISHRRTTLPHRRRSPTVSSEERSRDEFLRRESQGVIGAVLFV